MWFRCTNEVNLVPDDVRVGSQCPFVFTESVSLQ